MFGDRYQITFPLEVITPLHIGSGGYSIEKGLSYESDGGEKAPEVARIAKDQEGRPYIPGTTIKGILRTLPRQENVTTKLLFGDPALSREAENPDEAEAIVAVMAGCYFQNCYIDIASIPESTRNKQHQLPLYNDATATAVVARNAIDRATGAAEDKHLYYMEVTSPGVRFEVRLTLFSGEDEERRIRLLLALLTRLSAQEGVSFGHNQTAGYGSLRADMDNLRIEKKWLDEEGNLKTGEISCSEFEPPNRDDTYPLVQFSVTDKLALYCNGPFIVVGERTKSASTDDGEQKAQLNPLQVAPERPWLPGSSLKGMLRSECFQLQARKKLDVGEEVDEIKIDNLWRTLNPRSRLAYTANKAAELTPVERLLGVGGWRGLLHIVGIRLINKPEEMDLTSVKLDRFSGGPIDNALFTTKVVLYPEFELILALETRYGNEDREVRSLYEQMIERICTKGLVLGHGGNKGFGWFDVKRVGNAKEEGA